jgi:serine/threonine protein kinase
MADLKKHFTDREIKQIHSQHYYPIFWRGAGHTRDVFKALFKKNGLEKEVAFKITKRLKDIDDDSVCTLINLSKIHNPNTQEMEYYRQFDDHPNIASIRDSLIIIDGVDDFRYVTIEDWMDGMTLEEYVKSVGPLNKYNALKMSAATLRGTAYMHYRIPDDPWIMRDIKPSNTMSDKELYIRYTDNQNGKYQSQIKPQLLPTRGGTPYTHVKILNDFMQQKESKCDVSSDIYAWGGQLYFALTGKKPFNYSLENHKEGVPVDLGYKIITASVMLDGKPIKSIERDEHNEKLATIVKDVSEEWRPIIFDCMYWGDKTHTVKDIVKNIREIDTDNMFKESWHSIYSFIKKGKF